MNNCKSKHGTLGYMSLPYNVLGVGMLRALGGMISDGFTICGFSELEWYCLIESS